jgi:hypothetical protein
MIFHGSAAVHGRTTLPFLCRATLPEQTLSETEQHECGQDKIRNGFPQVHGSPLDWMLHLFQGMPTLSEEKQSGPEWSKGPLTSHHERIVHLEWKALYRVLYAPIRPFDLIRMEQESSSLNSTPKRQIVCANRNLKLMTFSGIQRPIAEQSLTTRQ